MAVKKYLDLDGLRKYTEELKGSFSITTSQQNGQVGLSIAGKTLPIPAVTDSSMGLMTPALKAKLDSLDLSGLVFKGGWEGTDAQFPTDAETGDFYVVTTGGATLNGVKLAAGDSVIKGENDDWYAIQSNVDVASDTTLGLVKGGQGTSVSADGSLNVKLQANGGLSLNENNELKVVIGDVSVENADHANTANSANIATIAYKLTEFNKPNSPLKVGSSSKPVYFDNGFPVEVSNEIISSINIAKGSLIPILSDEKSTGVVEVIRFDKVDFTIDGTAATASFKGAQVPTKDYVDGIVDSQISSITDAEIVGVFTTTQS
jgi:hypothetical protein